MTKENLLTKISRYLDLNKLWNQGIWIGSIEEHLELLAIEKELNEITGKVEPRKKEKNLIVYERVRFKEAFEDIIKEFGIETIERNKEEYLDGYTAASEEDYEEVFKANEEEFTNMLAEEMGIMLI